MPSVTFLSVHGVKGFGIWEAELGETRTETGKARSLKEKHEQNWGQKNLTCQTFP